ncbi:carboxypeptidase-like regulatory domain-containing protein [Flavobacterium sp.]|uniref:carboxypeptidase-like regulatory domain-containing protein n=1 Tax=Flavobacterium sp. TaxID=239 RepID=UPI0025DFC163|nr:carboxypeptidase-like regulatory domain-containing protein [Flavobacterium sp.]
MQKKLFTILSIMLSIQAGIAQNITGKIVDAKTNESIPYANITINHSENVVSNAEGYFTISESNSSDSSTIDFSYLGYQNRKMTVKELKDNQLIVSLEAGIVELENVNVSNIKPDAVSIMAEVKKHLNQHYKSELQPTKNKVFFRETQSLKPSILNFDIEKSTGFTKEALKSVNSQMRSFTAKIISHPPVIFSDMLSNYYTVTKKKEDKLVFSSKLDVIKATRLKDESNSSSLDDLEEKSKNLFLQHLDTTKYYRVKSGWFGSHDTISLRKDFHKKKRPSQVTNSKSDLNSFISQNNFLYSDKLNFVNKPEMYDYTYEGVVYSKDHEFVYVLSFRPRKSKAIYTGKLYISESDYAVLRADYTLAEGEKVSGFNMKFLLGIKSSENFSKGTIIYKPNPSGNGYYLQYATLETGMYIYINRPIKFIELADTERDVLAINLKIETNMNSKKEYLNILKSETTDAGIEAVKEEEFKYLQLRRYDPKIWKDYGAIEPLEEMKQFQASDQL